jgi:hypothetical protein
MSQKNIRHRERNRGVEKRSETGMGRKGLNTKLLIGFTANEGNIKGQVDEVYAAELLFVKQKRTFSP